MSFLVTLLLLTLLGLVLADQIRYALLALAAQGVALAGIAAVGGFAGGEMHLVVAALIALAVKAVAIPLVLLRTLRALHLQAEVERLMTTKSTVLISVGLMMLAYWVTSSLRLTGELARLGLPVALMMVLVGGFVMLTRRKAISHVIGLIVMENGLSLAALALLGEIPLVVDLALSFDALGGVLIMGLFIRRIQAEFHSENTGTLRKLRG